LIGLTMNGRIGRTNTRMVVLLTAGVLVALMVAMGVSMARPSVSIGIALGVVVGFVAFVNMEVAIHILILSMLLGPEFIVGEIGAKAAAQRGLTLRMDDFLLVVIVLGWLARTAVHRELALLGHTPLNRYIGYYLVACTLSTGIGMLAGRVDLVSGFFFVLKYAEYFVVYFMVVNTIESGPQMRRFIATAVVTASLVALFAIAQIPAGGRVTAPFEGRGGEPNTLGGYLVFLVAIASGFALTGRTRGTSFRWLGLAALLFVALLYTLSRASYLALLPMYGTLLLLSRRRLPLLVALLVGVLVAFTILPGRVKERVTETFAQPAQPGQLHVGGMHLDTSASTRIQSWKEAVKGWTAQPLLGFGVTGFRFMDAQFPRVLVETGLVGLGTFLLLLGVIARETYRIHRSMEGGLHRGLVLGYLAGFAALIGHAVGANTFIIVRIMEPFWLFTGMVMMLPSVQEKAKETEPEARATGFFRQASRY
jgi:O-antigen ligase